MAGIQAGTDSDVLEAEMDLAIISVVVVVAELVDIFRVDALADSRQYF